MKKFFRPDEVASITTLCKRTIYRLIKIGEIPSVFIRGIIKIPRSFVEPLLEESPFLRTNEVMELSNLSKEAIYRRVNSRKIKVRTLGGAYLFPMSEVERLLEGDKNVRTSIRVRSGAISGPDLHNLAGHF